MSKSLSLPFALCCVLISLPFARCFSQACITGGSVTGPLQYSGISNTIISGHRINPTGPIISSLPCISLDGCSNITIANCILGPSKNSVGISISNCSNVTITDCVFMDNTGGVYAVSSTGIKVDNNQFCNVKTANNRGQFVQFGSVTGAGNEIMNNVGENIFGANSDPEDLVNLYKSSGTAASPILVAGNRFRGGGPSMHGGGLLAGDEGGSYQTIQDNILVNPGQYGIAAASGTNINIVNNKIYSSPQSFNNVGIYVWNQYATTCGSITVSGNQVNYLSPTNVPAPFYDAANCGTITGLSTNVWNAAIGPEILPDRLLCPILMDYYKFNANWNDNSGSGLTAVTHNTAYAGQGENRMCANFDGSSSYLTIPNSDWLQPFSERITVSCWVKPWKIQGIQGVAQAQNADGYTNGWRMLLIDSNFNARITTSNGSAEINCSGITLGNWAQLVVTYDGKYLRGYVNGVLKSSTAITGSVVYSSTATPMKIGNCNGANYYFYGYMDEFKFYNGDLSPSEILQDYNSSSPLVNSPQPEIRASYSFNNSWQDNSGNGFTASNNGAGFVCDGGSSASAGFNGGTSNISLPQSVLLNPFSSNITVSCWIKPAAVSGIQSIAIAQKSDGYNDGWRMLLIDNNLNARVTTNQGSVDIYCPGIQAGIWNHVVMTYDGLTLKGYVNGTLAGSIASGGYIIYNASFPMQIGYNINGGYHFTGHIDEFKFYDGSLNASQVLQDYNGSYALINATPVCPMRMAAETKMASAAVITQGDGADTYTITPNPASTEIIIDPGCSYIHGTNKLFVLRAELYNSLGQRVRAINGSTGQLKMNVSGLSEGVYYLRLVSPASIVTKKVLVKR